MEVKLSCPRAEYREEMRIWCRAARGWCGNAYFKRCKGWWALTEHAARCPLRSPPDSGEPTP